MPCFFLALEHLEVLKEVLQVLTDGQRQKLLTCLLRRLILKQLDKKNELLPRKTNSRSHDD